MLLVCVAMVCLPLVLGAGASILINHKNIDHSISLWESCLYGLIGCLGIFEVSHLLGIFGDLQLSECSKVALLCVSMAGIISVLLVVWNCGRQKGLRKKMSGEALIPGVIFLMLLGAQIYYVFSVPMMVTAGDIMQETVCSFLSEDKVYGVSPLTGSVYGGAPLRYKILCLPTVYALLSRWTGISPDTVLDQLVPVLVICSAYMAYYLLSGSLFGEETDKAEKRLWFMVIVAAIFFLCEKNVYAEGYGILHASHLGTTMRNSVLVPLVSYASLKRKRMLMAGCVLAEACICWTFWGLGVCVVVAAGISAVKICFEKRSIQNLFFRTFGKEGSK